MSLGSGKGGGSIDCFYYSFDDDSHAGCILETYENYDYNFIPSDISFKDTFTVNNQVYNNVLITKISDIPGNELYRGLVGYKQKNSVLWNINKP